MQRIAARQIREDGAFFRDRRDRDMIQQRAEKRFGPPRKIGIEQRKCQNQAGVAEKYLWQVVEPSLAARAHDAVEHFKGNGFVPWRRHGVQRRKLPHSVRWQRVAIADQYQRNSSARSKRNGRRQMRNHKIRRET